MLAASNNQVQANMTYIQKQKGWSKDNGMETSPRLQRMACISFKLFPRLRGNSDIPIASDTGRHVLRSARLTVKHGACFEGAGYHFHTT